MVRTGRCSAILLIGLLGAFAPTPAAAWGDEGHRITALVADHFLEPAVRAKIEAMLAADIDDLTAHDIASEATWADRYRNSDRGAARNDIEAHANGTTSISRSTALISAAPALNIRCCRQGRRHRAAQPMRALSARSTSLPPNLPTGRPTPTSASLR